MTGKHVLAAGLLLVCGTALGVHAAEPAGMVKNSRGLVSIERAGQTIDAPVGTTVFAEDKLRTGKDSAVGVALKDQTLLSAGPNSLLLIDKFVFDSTTHEGKMLVGVRKGSVVVATGKIAKKTPESVDFYTPTTVLGVRGTEFAIEVAGFEE